MKKIVLFIFLTLILCLPGLASERPSDWSISVIPSSVRLDPVTHRVYDSPYGESRKADKLLSSNWIYDGSRVSLKAARGEYISFQLVLTNQSAEALKGIQVSMQPFRSGNTQWSNAPELFLAWSVQVKTPTTGYPKTTLGKGWYPDALIPFSAIQQGTVPPKGIWVYPLQLPDFNNRIEDQRSQFFWVDQYIPFDRKDAPAGRYTSTISVVIDGVTKSIPVQLDVWDFAIPNENSLKASLQHEGFVSSMTEKEELEIYQLMKRNRVCVMDPTYKPVLTKKAGVNAIDWTAFDHRLKKYLTGAAFTKEHGYVFGPGYGTPVETFLLPFDVYGKHDTRGWPDVGKPNVERNPANKAAYTAMIRQVRAHLKPLINPKTTDLTVYLNGLDESYFPEAWDRMAYYGNLFKKEYPEAKFRVDGSYNDTAMKVIDRSISAWAVHTIDFDENRMAAYTKKGIDQWLYGPMIYESKVNSWVGSSTFTDLPLVNDRAISWSVWKYRAHSWISWGIGAGWKAAWYDTETWKSANDGGHDNGNADGYDHKKMNGNALLIYSPGIIPNVKVAAPSIRLKTLRNGVQEYEYMRLLASQDKNKGRADALVNDVIARPFGDQSVGKLDVWSYDPELWDRKRLELGELINPSSKNK
ncbi:glycoside hydrolase domain-containing protein [Larkinella harenae]